MNTKTLIRLLTVSWLTAAAANAANLTWDANGASAGQTDGAGAWLNADLWWDGSGNVTWTSGDDATFGVAGTAGGAVTLASPTTVGSFTFNPFTGTYTLGTAGQTITLNGGIMKNTDSAAVNIISPITLGAAQIWTNNSTGALTASAALDNGGYILTIDNSGQINLTGLISGAGDIVKNGSGRLTFHTGNTNAYTGATTLNGGHLMIANNIGSLGAGNLTLNGGVLEAYWGLTISRTLGAGVGEMQLPGGDSGFSQNGGNQTFTVTVNNNAAYELVWGSTYFNPSTFVFQTAYSQNGANVTLWNKIDLNGTNRTIEVKGGTSGTAKATLNGQIRNSSGTAGLTKTGSGYLFLVSTASAWNGATTINGGWLDFAGIAVDSNIGGGAGVRDITVAAGAGVRVNTLSNAFLNRLVENTNEIVVMTGTTGNALDFSSSSGATLPGAFLSNYAGNGAKCEYSGVITPGGGAYRLGSLFQNGALGIRQESLLSGTNQVIIGGNRVVIVGTHTFTGDTTIRDGGVLGLSGLDADAGVAKNNSLALQNSVLDLGAPSATGLIFLEAGNAGGITGLTTVGNGGTQSATFGGLKGSRNLYSAFKFTSPGNNTSATVATNITGFTVNVAEGTTNTYSGAIGGFGAGAIAATGGGLTLTKTGLGTQVLSGANTYTGQTTVAAGKLGLDGANNIFPDATAVLWVAVDAKLDIAAGVNETVYRLYLNDGQAAAVGTWGGLDSSAQFKDYMFFSGAGVINVTNADPGAEVYVPATKGTVIMVR